MNNDKFSVNNEIRKDLQELIESCQFMHPGIENVLLGSVMYGLSTSLQDIIKSKKSDYNDSLSVLSLFEKNINSAIKKIRKKFKEEQKNFNG